MLVGEVASCVEEDSANKSKGDNTENKGDNTEIKSDKSANISTVKDLAGLPGKDLTAR